MTLPPQQHHRLRKHDIDRLYRLSALYPIHDTRVQLEMVQSLEAIVDDMSLLLAPSEEASPLQTETIDRYTAAPPSPQAHPPDSPIAIPRTLDIEQPRADRTSIKRTFDTHRESTRGFWETPGMKTYSPHSRPSSSPALKDWRVAVKDIFAMRSVRCSAGSKALQDWHPSYTATLVDRLEQEGATVVGRTAMDAFGMGSWTSTGAWGKCLHPTDPERSSGGSSGGSASVVAQGLCDIALGSDTGGSVRQPASFCGVVGYKPSYGAFSRYGMVAYASSLDCPGWFTKDLETLDSWIRLPSQTAPDLLDMQCQGLPPVASDVFRKAVVFPEIFSMPGLDRDVLRAYQTTIDKLAVLGWTIHEKKMPWPIQWTRIYYAIACAEAHSDLARYQGVYMDRPQSSVVSTERYQHAIRTHRTETLEMEVQRRILLGAAVLSGPLEDRVYREAMTWRARLRAWMHREASTDALVVMPVTAGCAPRWSEILTLSPEKTYVSDQFTVFASLLGCPAISTPWFSSSEGLPIGMQWIAPRWKDKSMIHTLRDLESSFA